MASNKPPALGGEMRCVTVFFSDLAGFSSFSEEMTPSELVALMNTYFTAMTEIIEAHDGVVDKYIGDAIVAVFGAPLDDRDHAVHAVQAAVACSRRLQELNCTAAAFKGRQLRCRIGLNTGEALVGNIGSQRRFNYTVMGDTVNLASRLEGANKYFATTIMASEMTVSLTGAAFVWRELDAVRVKGHAMPVKVFEPLAAAGDAATEQQARPPSLRRASPVGARETSPAPRARFAQIAAADPPAALFLKRATAFVRCPPGPSWEPITALGSN